MLFNILYLSEIDFLLKNIECNAIFKVKCYIQSCWIHFKILNKKIQCNNLEILHANVEFTILDWNKH